MVVRPVANALVLATEVIVVTRSLIIFVWINMPSLPSMIGRCQEFRALHTFQQPIAEIL